MQRRKEQNRLDISAEKVELTNKTTGFTKQNQNQQHNSVKQAQGQNTKR